MPNEDLNIAEEMLQGSEELLKSLEGLSHDEQVVELLKSAVVNIEDIEEQLSEQGEELIVVSDGVSYLMNSQKEKDEAALIEVDSVLPEDTTIPQYLDTINSTLVVLVFFLAAVIGILCWKFIGTRAG